MSKPRKKYRPRPISVDPIADAIYGSALMSKDRKDSMLMEMYVALDMLRMGKADRQQWNFIVRAANVGEALTEMRIGKDLRPEFDAGHEALHQVALRMLKTGSSTCHGYELKAIRECVAVFASQIDHCTNKEFAQAERNVERQLASGKCQDVKRDYEKLNRENP